MHLVLKHLYDLPADDGAHRYLLIETADECRHSSMFGEFIRAGAHAGLPGAASCSVGWARFMKATTRGPESYIAMLAAEELLDVSNRATMKDERVHPTSRRIAKIHVMEEARHVSFARSYVVDTWPTLSRFRRIVAMVQAPFVVAAITDAVVNPAVYDELGIEDGHRLAKHNPAPPRAGGQRSRQAHRLPHRGRRHQHRHPPALADVRPAAGLRSSRPTPARRSGRGRCGP